MVAAKEKAKAEKLKISWKLDSCFFIHCKVLLLFIFTIAPTFVKIIFFKECAQHYIATLKSKDLLADGTYILNFRFSEKATKTLKKNNFISVSYY